MGLLRGFFLLALLVGGLALAGYGWTMHQNEQSDVRQAVETEGTVESTDVKKIENEDDGTASFEPVVRYTYTYEGRKYTSESVYPGPEKRFKFEEDAQEVADRYSPGQTVTVYVNQETPSRAFLIEETGGNLLPYFSMGIGGLLALGSVSNLGKEIVGGGSG